MGSEMCIRDRQLLERMATKGWIARSGSDRYALVYDKDRLVVGDVYREFVLDGRLRSEAVSGETLDRLMAQFAARADEALGLPLGRLLEGEKT